MKLKVRSQKKNRWKLKKKVGSEIKSGKWNIIVGSEKKVACEKSSN